MKLPMESRPMTGLPSVPDVPVDTSTIEHTSFPDLEKEDKTTSGYITEGFESLQSAIVNFLENNIKEIKSKPSYSKLFKSLQSAIDISRPIIRKRTFIESELQQLNYLSKIIFYAFDRLNGGVLYAYPGYDFLMKSLYGYGQVLWRFVTRHQEFSESNPWKKYDPDT
jgi:hypothetical protein